MTDKNFPNKSDKVSLAIWAIGTLLGKTWRSRIISSQFSNPGFDSGSARIFCFWHSQLLPITFTFRNTGITAVASQSKDGKRAAAVAKLWKFNIIYGSSSHGGASALRQCLRTLNLKRSIGITPDGPRGPREIVKPGVSQLSIISHAPVITITALPQNAWYLNSWDRFMIPKPFSRIKFVISEPINCLSSDSSDVFIEKFRLQIQERLCADGKLAR